MACGEGEGDSECFVYFYFFQNYTRPFSYFSLKFRYILAVESSYIFHLCYSDHVCRGGVEDWQDRG